MHALPQVHGLRIAGIEEAKVVEAEAQAPGQLGPRAGTPARRVDELHVREARRDSLDHPAPADRLLAIGRERDRVTARRERFDSRLEQPQI